jgi:phosphatidylinositol-bisphosphatase
MTQGNKGATAIRLLYNSPPTDEVKNPRPVTLTFVNAHLAAFDDMVEKRNSDFYELSRRLAFPVDSALPGEDPASRSVFWTDALFWMVRGYALASCCTAHAATGRSVTVYLHCLTRLIDCPQDLNYRIDLPDDDVRTLLRADEDGMKLRELIRRDQVRLTVCVRVSTVYIMIIPA